MLLIRISKRKNFRIFMCSKHTNEPPFPSGGGAKSAHCAGLRLIKTVKRFGHLEVEKDLIIFFSTATSLCPIFTSSPRPITAPTSQVGEVAVVRTSVSYKCGWGINNVKYTPTLTLPAGEGTRVVVRLAHIPRPLLEMVIILKESAPILTFPRREGMRVVAQLAHSPRPFGEREQLFLSRQAKVTDAGEGLKNQQLKQHPLPPSGTSPARGAEAAALTWRMFRIGGVHDHLRN